MLPEQLQRALLRRIWRDPAAIAAVRQDYERRVAEITAVAARMRSEGRSEEEVARFCWSRRNELRWEARRRCPRGVRVYLKWRDFRKYGDTNGPQIGWLRETKDWPEIIEGSSRPGGRDLGL